jgi:hypothetical protein
MSGEIKTLPWFSRTCRKKSRRFREFHERVGRNQDVSVVFTEKIKESKKVPQFSRLWGDVAKVVRGCHGSYVKERSPKVETLRQIKNEEFLILKF